VQKYTFWQKNNQLIKFVCTSLNLAAPLNNQYHATFYFLATYFTIKTNEH
jgi:hypothetical protein